MFPSEQNFSVMFLAETEKRPPTESSKEKGINSQVADPVSSAVPWVTFQHDDPPHFSDARVCPTRCLDMMRKENA